MDEEKPFDYDYNPPPLELTQEQLEEAANQTHLTTQLGESDAAPEYTKNPKHRNPFKIVTRAEWQAQSPAEVSKPLVHPVSELLVYSETSSQWCYTEEECCAEVRMLQKRDMEEGHPDIKYNFLLAMDGRAYEGTGWDIASSPLQGHEKLHGKSLSIGYIGYYEDWKKPDVLIHRTEELLKVAIENKYLTEDYHRTDKRCGVREITDVMNIIEDRFNGKRSLYDSPYLP